MFCWIIGMATAAQVRPSVKKTRLNTARFLPAPFRDRHFAFINLRKTIGKIISIDGEVRLHGG